MALSDRDIIIVPSRGTSVEPIITLRGADAASSGTITLRVVNSSTSAALSFEGTSGQLFSISDYPSSTVFSVNDVSGIPNIEVLDTGLVKLSEYNGYVQVGSAINSENATSTSSGELRVVGGMGVWKDLYVGGTIYANQFNGTTSVATNVNVTDASSTAGTHYLTFVTGTSGGLGIRADSGLAYIPSTNRLGIGRTPDYSLDVAAQSNPFQTVARFGTGGSDILITHANAIISHNASFNGSWTRTGSGYAGQIDFQGGKFEFQTSPTTAAGGTAITDWNTRFIILNNGNVGIGNSSPGVRFVVEGPGSDGTPVFRLNSTTASSTFNWAASFLNSGLGAGRNSILLIGQAESSKNSGYIGFNHSGTGGSNNNFLTFGLFGVDNVLNITGAGNVGIGDTTPSQKLVVAGGAVVTGGIYGAETGAPDAPIWRISGDYPNWGIFYNEGDPDYIEYQTGGTVTSRIALDTGAAHFGLNGGFVGIGTNAPAVRLQVSGASIIANNTGIDPDAYVNTVVAGAIADGSGWGVSSAIGGNAGTGDSWAIGHNGNYLYYAVGNGAADNTFASYMVTGGTGRHLWLVPSSGGSVGIGIAEGTNPGRRLDVNGVANFRDHIAQTIDHSRPNVAWGASGSSTGAVIIKFPGTSANYGMIHCVIDVYTYDGENASTIIVGGHNWNSAWYNYGANRVGAFSKGVRVGFKDGQYCIVLGTNTSTWSYGQVRVRKIQNGSYYTGIMDLSGTYTISQDAAAESYTWISSNLIVVGAAGAGGWNSSNDGAGSGLDADLLDGIDSSSFVRDDSASFGYIQLEGGTQNSPTDATLYVTATNNNDWLLKLNAQNSSKTEYGMYVAIPSAATYAYAVQTNSSSWNWRINGSGHSFSPIYYDVNDTSRYMDMDGNNISQIGTLRLNGNWNGSGVHPEAFTIRGDYPSLTLRSTSASSPVWLLHNDNGSTLYWYNAQGQGVDSNNWGWRWNLNSSGTMIATGDIRSPIFYDYDDTNFYLDPNGTSRLANLTVTGTLSASISGTANSVAWRGRIPAEINRDAYASGVYTFSTFTAANNGGNPPLTYPEIIAWGDGSSGSIQIAGDWISTTSTPLRVRSLRDCCQNWSSWSAIATSNESFTNNVDLRAPIFYDSNDTSYYLDPAADLSLRVYGEIANSNYSQGNLQPGALNIGRTDRDYGWDGTSWASDIRSGILANCSETWEFNIHDSGDSVMSLVRFNGGNQLLMGRNIGWGTCYVEAAQDFRAPIFYDSNDTNFYLDPNGTSRIGGIQISPAESTTTGNGIRFYGLAGDGAGSYNHAAIIERLWGTTDQSELLIFKGNDPDTATIHDRMRIVACGRVVFHSYNAYGTVDDYITAAGTGNINGSGFFNGTSFYVTGEVTAYYSDERLKEKISPVENVLDKIQSLNVFTYKNNELAASYGYETDKVQIGVSAQEVQKVFPELVDIAAFDFDEKLVDGKRVTTSKSGENYLTVKYERMNAVLLQAIKEQQALINKLQQDVEELKSVNKFSIIEIVKKTFRKILGK